MTNDINRAVDPAPQADLSTGEIYRVKQLTRDSDRNSDKQFEERLKKEKKKESDNEEASESDHDSACLDDLNHQSTGIHDDVILSDSARKELENADGTSTDKSEVPGSEVIRENEDPQRNTGKQHINLIA